jgi:metal-responsive CopG/Arc/MetJ family transcriptional regulator
MINSMTKEHTMLRKTITIDEELFKKLELNHITQQYQSFSELVSNALQLLVEKKKKEHYKQAMIEASKDVLYLQDMKETEEAFKESDFEKDSKDNTTRM